MSNQPISIFRPEGITKKDLLAFLQNISDDAKLVIEIDVGIPPRSATLLLHCRDERELYIS